MTFIQKKYPIGYGVLAFPLAMVALPLYIQVPKFYEGEFQVPLETIGFILLGLRLLDAFQDPIIGWISDKKKNQITQE
tara:strand:- start:579 stop:812 length:234 start_codon:yes stop_codon:yes gene_type:complete